MNQCSGWIPSSCRSSSAQTTAADALRYPAVQLFAERAAACLHHFQLTDDDIPTVVEICRKLDGLPLAIELAAARVDVFGIRGLDACLNDRLGFLTRGPRTAIPRHRTLRATLDWSYELLPEVEQTALRRLSVFAGRFDDTSAAAIICDTDTDPTSVLNILTDLAAKSLITVKTSGDQVWYQLLNTSRAYAAEKLEAGTEAARIKQRHARLCCSWGEAENEWEPGSVDKHDCDSRRIDDVRAALNWCFSTEGDTTLGVELTAKSAHYWFQLSFLNEYRTYLERALEVLPNARSPKPSSCEFMPPWAMRSSTRGEPARQSRQLSTRRWPSPPAWAPTPSGAGPCGACGSIASLPPTTSPPPSSPASSKASAWIRRTRQSGSRVIACWHWRCI